MIRQRKTKAERERVRVRKDSDADQHAWDLFQPKLAALKSIDEARALVANAPLQNTPGRHAPGRKFYSNLATFIGSGSFMVLGGLSHEERSLYLEFIKRIDAAGELKPGVGEKVKSDLRNPLAERGVL